MIHPITTTPKTFSLPPSESPRGTREVLNDDVLQIISSFLSNKDRTSVSVACQRFHKAVSFCIKDEYYSFLKTARDLNEKTKPENYQKIALFIQQAEALVENMAPHSRERGLSVERIRLLAKAGCASLGQLSASRAIPFRPTLPQAPSGQPLHQDTTQPTRLSKTFKDELKETWTQQENNIVSQTTIFAMLKRGDEGAFSMRVLTSSPKDYKADAPYAAYLYTLLASGKGVDEIVALFSKIRPLARDVRQKLLTECVDALLYRETMDDVLAICHRLPLIDPHDIKGIEEEIVIRTNDDVKSRRTAADNITDPSQSSIAFKTIARVLWKYRKHLETKGTPVDHLQGWLRLAIEAASKIPLNNVRSAVLRYMSMCLLKEKNTTEATTAANMIRNDIIAGTPYTEPSKIEEILPPDVAKATSQDNPQDDEFQILKKWFETQEPFQISYFSLTENEANALSLVFTNCVLRMGAEKAIEQARLLKGEQKQSIAFRSIAACLCAKENVDAAIAVAQQIKPYKERNNILYDMATCLKMAGKKNDTERLLQLLPPDEREIDLDEAQPWVETKPFVPLNAQATKKEVISQYEEEESCDLFEHLARLEGVAHAFNVAKHVRIKETLSQTDPCEDSNLPTDKEFMDEIMDRDNETGQGSDMRDATKSSIQAGRLEEALKLYEQTGNPDVMTSPLCKALLARGRVEEAKEVMKKHNPKNEKDSEDPYIHFFRLFFDQPISNPTHDDLQYFVETGNFCRAVNSDTQFSAKRLAKAIAQTASSSLPALPAPTEQKN